MGKHWIYIVLALMLPLATSCLFENDMSYPTVPGDILEFSVEGQVSVDIDREEREVKIVLGETCDISDVVIEKFVISEGASVVGDMPEHLDLSSPVVLTLKTYQEYEWTISATRPVARYIDVDNQVGKAEFNLKEKIAIVYVTESQPLSSVNFKAVKLEPEGSSVVSTSGKVYVGGEIVEETLDCVFPMTLDCVLSRTFLVRMDGQEIVWTVKVLQKTVNRQIESVNARCYHALVRGTFSGSDNPSIEYRKSDETQWKTADDALVAGVGISVDIKGLEPATSYSVRVVDGDAYSAEYTFTTESPLQLPNMGFDDWWQDGKVWYPYLEDSAEKVWDSANKATSAFIGSSTTPEESIAISGKSARMESKFAVIAFAAGNMYTGRFNKIDGLGADLDWGVPFSSRPAALKGHYYYTPVKIDRAKEPYKSLLGQTDKCQIQIFLTDWDKPFNINTSKGIFVDFEKDEHIIAYAKMESDEPTMGWKDFKLELEYRDTERIPKYVVITCCASYLGDYFTGGVGSLLYVDEFEFEYE